MIITTENIQEVPENLYRPFCTQYNKNLIISSAHSATRYFDFTYLKEFWRMKLPEKIEDNLYRHVVEYNYNGKWVDFCILTSQRAKLDGIINEIVLKYLISGKVKITTKSEELIISDVLNKYVTQKERVKL